MRPIALHNLRGDEIVATNIVDMYGRMLIAKGVSIKLSYLEKLTNAGISTIYIEDEISEGIEVENVLCDETKHMAKVVLDTEMNRFLKKREMDMSVINRVTNMIINEILTNRTQLINSKDIRLKDEYLFSHSISVCALTVFLCTKMGMDEPRTHSIGAGAMLHDFGKMLIPEEVLNKSDKLSDDEWEEIKQHPVFGYEAIKNDITINPISKMVVYMHHERLDGSGYPSGLTGEKIHESAKIVSVCNTFDSLSNDRPYRKAYPTSDVVEYLTSTAGIYFDKHIVDEFLKYIPMYPPGTIVLLNSGVIAIVLKNNKSVNRPVVRLLFNTKNKVKYGADKVIDLMDDLTLKIEREINYHPDDVR